MEIDRYLEIESNPIIREDIKNIILEPNINWDFFREKTVLVSGGAGFLASYLIKALLAANASYELNLHIIALIRSHRSLDYRFRSWLYDQNIQFVERNIVLPLPKGFAKADIIIHAASQASPKYYGIDPVGTLLPNTIGTLNLLDYGKESNAKKLVFFSSGEVYGSRENTDRIREDEFGSLDPLQLRSCYAESKRMGENICISYSSQYNLLTNVIRPFHTYGPGMYLDDGRVFADFVSDVVNNKNIVLRSDGSAKRAFCYISDATTGFLTVIIKGGSNQAYNIGNPFAEISMKDLAQVLVNLYPERKLGIEMCPVNSENEDKNYLKSQIHSISPSIEKVQKLGWLPKIGIEEGFTRTIQSYISTK